MRRLTALTAGLALALVMLAAAAAEARTIRVGHGDSIQAAVDQANSGDTIQVRTGTYREDGQPCPAAPSHTCAVVVTKDNIKIVGLGKNVVLDNAGDQDEGIAVGKTDDPACLTDDSLQVNGSLIKGITVTDFEDDGLFLYCVDGFRITQVRATGNLEYSIFPSHSFNGRVDRSFASGANDTGFYVGQSQDVRMDHNVATENVSGYEIENSTGVRADHNEAFGNTGGILSFTLPFLDVKQNSDNQVDHNNVHDNNKANTCLDPEDAVCGVPVGTGILLVAADTNRVTQNTSTGNDTFGIAVSNFCLGTDTPPEICALLDIQPDSDGNHITSNEVTGNGGNPDPDIAPFFAVDLAWDTTGVGNCWSNNVFGTSFPDPLPAC